MKVPDVGEFACMSVAKDLLTNHLTDKVFLFHHTRNAIRGNKGIATSFKYIVN